jgi:hypothetical protein
VRDYLGVPYSRVTEGDWESNAPIIRRSLATIDYFLRDLSRGVQRISQGLVPDGSGDSIFPDTGDFFILKGRSGGQRGHGDKNPSGNLWLSSTYDSTKGFIYFGNPTAGGAFDETNTRLGIGTSTPSAKLHAKTTAAAVYGRPASDISIQLNRVGGAANYLCVNEETADGNTSYVVYNTFPNGSLLEIYGGTPFTYTGTATGFQLVVVSGKFGGDAATRTWQHDVRIEKLDGTDLTDGIAGAWNLTSNGVNTYYTFTYNLTDAECAAVVANSSAYQFRLSTRYGGAGTPTSECRITQVYLLVNATSGDDLAYFDQGGTRVASINIDGAGQFQNLILEDPGVGTGTITHKAPTAPTSHSLVWPGVTSTGVLHNTTSGTTGTLSWSLVSLTADVTGVLPLANGGTNKALTAVNGGIVYTDADSMEITAAGTSSQVLIGGAPPAFGTVTGSMIGTPEFVDSAFRILGSGDATKKLAIEVDGITTGTTRTWTAQNSSGTVALLEANQTWSGSNTFSSGATVASGAVWQIACAPGDAFLDIDDTSTTFHTYLASSASGLTGNVTIYLPSPAGADCVLAMVDRGQTWSGGVQQFQDSGFKIVDEADGARDHAAGRDDDADRPHHRRHAHHRTQDLRLRHVRGRHRG